MIYTHIFWARTIREPQRDTRIPIVPSTTFVRYVQPRYIAVIETENDFRMKTFVVVIIAKWNSLDSRIGLFTVY